MTCVTNGIRQCEGGGWRHDMCPEWYYTMIIIACRFEKIPSVLYLNIIQIIALLAHI